MGQTLGCLQPEANETQQISQGQGKAKGQTTGQPAAGGEGPHVQPARPQQGPERSQPAPQKEDLRVETLVKLIGKLEGGRATTEEDGCISIPAVYGSHEEDDYSIATEASAAADGAEGGMWLNSSSRSPSSDNKGAEPLDLSFKKAEARTKAAAKSTKKAAALSTKKPAEPTQADKSSVQGPVEPSDLTDLKGVFMAFASFGSAVVRQEMTGKNFAKLFKDSEMICPKLTTTDLDIIFAKVKHSKGAQHKMGFEEFLVALEEVATRKGVPLNHITAALMKTGAPIAYNSTRAENVRWHDDKSTYTAKSRAPSRDNVLAQVTTTGQPARAPSASNSRKAFAV